MGQILRRQGLRPRDQCRQRVVAVDIAIDDDEGRVIQQRQRAMDAAAGSSAGQPSSE